MFFLLNGFNLLMNVLCLCGICGNISSRGIHRGRGYLASGVSAHCYDLKTRILLEGSAGLGFHNSSGICDLHEALWCGQYKREGRGQHIIRGRVGDNIQ